MIRLHFAILLILLVGAGAGGWYGHLAFWEESLEKMTPQQRALYVLRGREYAEDFEAKASSGKAPSVTVGFGSPPRLKSSEGVTFGKAPSLDEPESDLGSSASISLSDKVRIRTGVGHSRSINGEAIEELTADWSQIYVTITREGASIAEVATALKTFETDLRKILDDVELAEAEIKHFNREIAEETRKQRDKRVRDVLRAGGTVDEDVQPLIYGSLKLAINYRGVTTFDEILTHDKFVEVGEVSTPYYWFDDRNAALAPLKDAALASAMAQAADAAGSTPFDVQSVNFKTSLDKIKGYRYSTPKIRVQVTAKAFVRFGG